MRKLAVLASVACACVALCGPSLAQSKPELIIPEFLAPQYTAPEGAPSSVVIAGQDEPGARMVVTGRTLIGGTPVAGVSLYVFHTDSHGKYSKTTDDNRVGEYNPRLHGALRTDAQGRYRFETTRPGSYDNGASHVHYIVKAPGYKPLLLVLQFEDDPFVVTRRAAGRPLMDDQFAFQNGACKGRPDCILTQPVTRDAQGVSHVTRDIQMVKE